MTSDALPIPELRASAPQTVALSALVIAAGDRAGLRLMEFFAANIRNPHTRRAYRQAVVDFLAWCEDAGVGSIAQVQPLHVRGLGRAADT